MENLIFKRLKIKDWKQFESVEIDFHPRLTILTGANGSGKTTILNILSGHFGWNFFELSTPAKDKESGISRFFSWFFKAPLVKLGQFTIGELIYSNDKTSILAIPDVNAPSYKIDIYDQQPLKGINIPSHRPTFSYKEVTVIPTKKRTKNEAFDVTSNSLRNYYFGSGGQLSNYHIKQTLLSWAIAGFGNEFIESDNELRNYFKGFQDVLKKVLPKEIGFIEIKIRNYEIVLITSSGDFMLDAVSGGVSSIIDLVWQIYTFENSENESMIVLIDEVENHLHPNMQRTILPSLLDAFPNTQFVISTHSPLIVGSVKESNVHVFRFYKNDEGYSRVMTERLDLVDKAKTATEILNEVLGVPFTMPLWAEDELNEVVKKYSNEEITEKTFDDMRNDLKKLGLEELMPNAIKKTLKK